MLVANHILLRLHYYYPYKGSPRSMYIKQSTLALRLARAYASTPFSVQTSTFRFRWSPFRLLPFLCYFSLFFLFSWGPAASPYHRTYGLRGFTAEAHMRSCVCIVFGANFTHYGIINWGSSTTYWCFYTVSGDASA